MTDETMMRVRDVAEFAQVSPRVVRNAITAGRLVAVQFTPNGAFRISPDDVRAWLDACRFAPRAADPEPAIVAVAAAPARGIAKATRGGVLAVPDGGSRR